MKRLFWVLITMIIFVACSKKAKVTEVPDAIRGLASPLKMGFDTTTIRLYDYFSDLKGISSVSLTEAMTAAMPGFDLAMFMDTVSGEITFANENLGTLYNLRIVKEGKRYDIPAFASDKQEIVFRYRGNPGAKKVEIAGSINGWNPKATPLSKDSLGWSTTLVLSPGRYPYQLVIDDEWKLNPETSETQPNGQGGFNSVLKVGDPDYLKPVIYSSFDSEGILIDVQGGTNDLQLLVYLDNTLIPTTVPTDNKGFARVKLPEGISGRHHIRVFGGNKQVRTNDLLIPLSGNQAIVDVSGLNRFDYQRNIMYFVMVDRFVDGNRDNNRPTQNDSIHPKANNLGGDLIGICQKLESGYFKDLGINTLWISPISRNAEGAWGLWTKGVTSKFSGYHGYWPTALRAVDDRFGTGQDLTQLLDASHGKDMNVILDFVAHHVHQEHPLYQEHPDWATDLHLPDGTLNTERWDEHRLTTWFDVFLPTWDFARPEVRLALSDSAMYWLRNYDLDGFRHDATKHVPVEFWRDLTRQIKIEIDRPVYQIGETYGNPELIGSYVNSGQMDGQFDFNLYDAMVDAFANDGRGFENLGRVLNQSLEAYGSHHLMGNITGNQDRARFASYADGSVAFSEDAKLAGWTRDIQNQGDAGFRKMESLMAFIMTVPGIPCIYYGDEIAMPGGNDPDNRRMMVFDGLNENQLKTKEITSRLAHLRSSNMALIYGQTFILKSDNEALVIARKYMNDIVLAVFTSGKGTIELELPSYLMPDSWTPVFGNKIQKQSGNIIELDFEGSGFEILTSFYRKG